MEKKAYIWGNHSAVNMGQCALNKLRCIMYNVQYTDYNVQVKLYSIQYKVYTVHCTDILYSVYTVHCTVYRVQCILYSVHCTMYILQCTKEDFLNVTSIMSSASFFFSFGQKKSRLFSFITSILFNLGRNMRVAKGTRTVWLLKNVQEACISKYLQNLGRLKTWFGKHASVYFVTVRKYVEKQ